MTDNADAMFRKAVAQHTRGALADALTLYGAVIREAPHLPAAHSNRAAVLIALRKFEPALKSTERALELDPDFADAWNNRGNALEGLGRADEALASYDRAIALNSTFAAAHSNRGNVLRALGRLDDAVSSYDAALGAAPDHVDAHYNRGIALRDLKRFEEAIASYDRAITLRPDHAEAHNNRGNARDALDRLEEALADYERAIALRPVYPEALNNRGVALRHLGRMDGALESFDRALKLVPDFADAHWNRALCLLQLGCFEEGWREYEWRLRRADPSIPCAAPEKLWNGGDIAGKTLLILAEQGLGDTIQFCRHALRARASGAKVILSVPDRLVRLVRSMDADLEVIGSSVPLPSFDAWIPLLSLPRLFAGDPPREIPYLRAEHDRVDAWRAKLGNDGFKIGICWQGEKDAAVDLGRSFPVNLFEGIANIPGVRLFSLQKGAGAEQLASLSGRVETLGDTFDAGVDAFLDSAAVMECLDLVIACDTAVAHLAGALGRPVWVALRRVPDWRWRLDSRDTPWYPTMRLFRQHTRGDWAGVFSDMESQLRETMTEQPLSTPRIPVSWGELIDRLTILEIKAVRIAEDAALANVRKELIALKVIAEPARQRVVDLASRLRSLNEELWDLENRIRAKEKEMTFDAEFVSLARAIYAANDERAHIKREISVALGSEFLEEKSY